MSKRFLTDGPLDEEDPVVSTFVSNVISNPCMETVFARMNSSFQERYEQLIMAMNPSLKFDSLRWYAFRYLNYLKFLGWQNLLTNYDQKRIREVSQKQILAKLPFVREAVDVRPFLLKGPAAPCSIYLLSSRNHGPLRTAEGFEFDHPDGHGRYVMLVRYNSDSRHFYGQCVRIGDSAIEVGFSMPHYTLPILFAIGFGR